MLYLICNIGYEVIADRPVFTSKRLHSKHEGSNTYFKQNHVNMFNLFLRKIHQCNSSEKSTEFLVEVDRKK